MSDAIVKQQIKQQIKVISLFQAAFTILCVLCLVVIEILVWLTFANPFTQTAIIGGLAFLGLAFEIIRAVLSPF